MLIHPAINRAVLISMVIHTIVSILTCIIDLLRGFVIYFILLVSCLPLINICCQGDGSPDNVHPHFCTATATTISEHHIWLKPSRTTLSGINLLQIFSRAFVKLSAISFRNTFQMHSINFFFFFFCEILPLNHMSVTYHFPGFVLNI
jgi:hypothetical protein